MTSNFARVKKIPPGFTAVGIAVNPPWYFRGPSEKRLAPRKEMLGMTREEYIREFNQILKTLDPQEVFDSLPEQGVLLCWESPKIFCHRRRVAEWFEENLGIVVCEMDFPDRDAFPRYVDMKEKPAKKVDVPESTPSKDQVNKTQWLFRE
ncbi:hypothetical protein SH668x_001216 [Planctomicrobium sp. SH668]|uniref:hypothetical protein n=1 Tax=Planctomicrobium sp. SH668 TaxID=3448126 RepID=UPI003F5C1B51